MSASRKHCGLNPVWTPELIQLTGLQHNHFCNIEKRLMQKFEQQYRQRSQGGEATPQSASQITETTAESSKQQTKPVSIVHISPDPSPVSKPASHAPRQTLEPMRVEPVKEFKIENHSKSEPESRPMQMQNNGGQPSYLRQHYQPTKAPDTRERVVHSSDEDRIMEYAK